VIHTLTVHLCVSELLVLPLVIVPCCIPVVPKVGGGITEVGANRYERWKGALLLSQGGTSRQVVHFL
jgi:hypothetical protein